VEAARIGEQGKAFAIVAEAVQEAAKDVRDTSTSVLDVSESIQRVVGQVSNSIQRLKA